MARPPEADTPDGDLRERVRQAELAAAIGAALTSVAPLPDQLQRCAAAIVAHLDVAFARIWTLDAATQILELRASAGLYTHLDGAHSRIPVGEFKIGRIARERRPHLTNAVVGDPQVHDQAWARREGMVAFAGYPLIAGARVAGVLGLFARRALPASTLGALAAAADTLAVGIARAEADAARERLLTDQAALAADNARLYQGAQEALRLRDHFLATVAHDLNTPLTVIRGQAQLLHRLVARGGGEVDPRLALSVGQIERTTAKMSAMVGELADLSQLAAGQTLALNRRRADLVALARQVTAEHHAASPGHRVRLDARAPALVGAWDSARLERALDNLLGNAIKFSPDGGEVAVTAAREDDAGGAWAVLTVRDSGLGIPAADLPRIFEPFYRAENVAGRVRGTGLGLAGARHVVEQHGGTLAATSRVGAGSTFTIRLPLPGVGASP